MLKKVKTRMKRSNNKHASKNFLIGKTSSIKNLLTKVKVITAFILGSALTGGAVYAATILLNANQVGFDKTGTSLSSTDVQGALDELYTKSKIFDSVPYMQNFDKTSLQSTGDSVKAIDTRDGNIYTVRRLADDNIWMTENLRIEGKTLTSEDSDVTSNFTLPASSTAGFNVHNTSYVYVDNTFGGYYSYYAVTAGTVGTSQSSGDAPSSICPKGWRLPTEAEYQTLYDKYNSLSLLQGEPGFVLSGQATRDTIDNYGLSQNITGGLWSSTIKASNIAYFIGYNEDNYVQVDNGGVKYCGLPIHCVAR